MFAIQYIRGAFADHFTWHSQILRHSLRLSATLSIATFIDVFFQIPHGHWLPLTVAIILKPDFHSSRQRAFQRVGGTMAGGILAFMITATIHNELILFPLIIVFLFLATINHSHNYGVYAFFWIPVIVFLLDLNHFGDWIVAMERISITFAGGILGIGALYLFLPQWEKVRLPEQIAKLLSANHNFMYEILNMYSGKSDQSADLEQIRQQTYRECINSSASLLRFSEEPKSKQANFENFSALIIYNRRLSTVLSALSFRNNILASLYQP
ncbi:FUSC family protein [Desulfosporosinus fructosivorans]